ncbi:MAG TPA: hypothetical protein VF791_13625 [Pyrinomonadaceae bacterium]
MKSKKIGVIWKLLVSMFLVALIVVVAFSLTRQRQLGLTQQAKPKCTCWFPQEKKYGVLDEKEGCKIVDCELPKKASKPGE